METLFTVYQITNLLNNKIYIGSHITTNLNDGYLGSSKHLKKDIKLHGKPNFKKEILHIFKTKEEMIEMESLLVNKDFCYREDTYNRMVGGITGSFGFHGMTTVINSKGEKLKVYLDDPRYLSGDLISIFANTVPVIDKDGNIFRINKNDERYLSGELLFEKTGFVPVKDISGNTYSIPKSDARISSGELKHVCTGQVTVKTSDGTFLSVKKDDSKYLSGEYKHNMTDMIVVKDNLGNRLTVNRNDTRYISGELVSVHKGRVGIKGMLGKHVSENVKQVLREKAKLRVGEKSSGYNSKWLNDGSINKRVKSDEIEFHLKNGWKLGQFKN